MLPPIFSSNRPIQSPLTAIIIAITLLGQIRQPKTGHLLFVVRPYQPFPVPMLTRHTHPAVRIGASAGLHAQAGLYGGNHVGACGVELAAANHFRAVGVGAGEVEEVHSRKGDEEAG